MTIAPDLIGTRYRILRQLGAGGMGVVYEADDRLTGDTVALKLVAPRAGDSLNDSGMSTGARFDFALQLAREFQTLASLRHPHIISVLDYGFDSADERQIYYTMELLRGARTILAAGAERTTVGKIGLIIDLLQALAYLHRRGILHRDVKPENVLVDAADRLKVLDFGLSTLRDQPINSESISGTFAYLAPELFMEGAPTEASDLYAAGLIAYELLAGYHPYALPDFNQMLRAILRSEPDLAPLAALDNAHTGGLNRAITYTEVIVRLLAKDPKHRYQNANDVIRDLYIATGQRQPGENPAIRDSYLQAARFVGREREVMQLDAALDAALSGQGSAWLVTGESGIGKSRLLDELRTIALVKGALVLRGGALELGGQPFELWRAPLRRLALVAPMETQEASVLKPLIPDIDSLLQRPIPDAPALEGSASHQRLVRTVQALFQRAFKPVLLLLDDLQWAGESLGVLAALVPLTAELPLMIVGSSREDEMPDLPARLPEARLMRLARLAEADVEALSAAMLGERGRSPDLLALIQAQTEGNVYFIVEVMRTLAENAGSLARIGERGLPDDVRSGGIQTLLMRRVQRLPTAAVNLLRVAAIMGRALDLRVMAQIGRQDAAGFSLDEWLLVCADAAVLEFVDDGWRFTHDQLRGALIADARAGGSEPALNERAANAIESAYLNEDDRARRAAALAQHWGVAGRDEREQYYLVLAGERAFSDTAYDKAVDFFKRALAIMEQRGVPPAERAAVMGKLTEAHYSAGSLEQGYAYSLQTLALLGYHPSRAGTVRRRLDALWQLARQIAYRVLSMRTRRPREEVVIALKVMEPLIMIHYFQNQRAETLYHMLYGLNIADANKQVVLAERARFYATATVMVALVGLRRLARSYRRSADRLLERVTSAQDIMWICTLSGIYTTIITDWEAGRVRLRRSIENATQIAYARRFEEAAVTLAAVHYYSGEWEAGRALSQELLESSEKSGNLQGVGWAIDNFGRYALRAGRFDEARAHFQRSFGVYTQTQDTIGIVWLHGAIAKTYLCEGRLDDTQIFIDQIAPVLYNTLTTSFGMIEAYGAIIDYYFTRLEQGDSSVEARVSEGIEHLERYARVFRLAYPRWWMYRAYLAHCQGKARQSAAWFARALAAAQRPPLPFEVGLVHSTWARCLPAGSAAQREHAAAAAALFEQLGAEWELAQVRRMLHNGGQATAIHGETDDSHHLRHD